MKTFIYLTATTLALLAGGRSMTSGNHDPSNPIAARTFLTQSDAEKILGEPAHVGDSLSTTKADVVEYKGNYIANSKDEKTGKTGSIYFLLEEYKLLPAAKEKYSSIKKANENHEGVKTLHDIGDEAYFHSDGENFYFVMVRKGKKVFNMKVNKITSKTSLDAFNAVAKGIADSL
jgi:hypothetical protein